MKLRKTQFILFVPLIISACTVIPKETVVLSETLGDDLQVLHKSHRTAIELQYNRLKDDVNRFVNEVYAPFVIHYVLADEYESFKKGESSIFKTLIIAAESQGQIESENALQEMIDFQTAANEQIEGKRSELLTPIEDQESGILNSIDQAYSNVIYANATITGHLKSIQKVKDTQQEALSKLGLGGVDTVITNALVRTSNLVEKAIEKAKDVDVKSDVAYRQMEEISNTIKNLTKKK